MALKHFVRLKPFGHIFSNHLKSWLFDLTQFWGSDGSWGSPAIQWFHSSSRWHFSSFSYHFELFSGFETSPPLGTCRLCWSIGAKCSSKIVPLNVPIYIEQVVKVKRSRRPTLFSRSLSLLRRSDSCVLSRVDSSFEWTESIESRAAVVRNSCICGNTQNTSWWDKAKRYATHPFWVDQHRQCLSLNHILKGYIQQALSCVGRCCGQLDPPPPQLFSHNWTSMLKVHLFDSTVDMNNLMYHSDIATQLDILLIALKIVTAA